MVIKRSPGEPCRWRAVNFEIHLWSSGMNADCIWRSICIQHVQIEAGLNSDPGNDSFWDKSVTLSMFIDLLTGTCRSTQVKIASTDLRPQEMFTFSDMLALVESESSFGAYVCHGRPGGSLATSDLVPKTIANRKRDCAWVCARRINTTWENLPLRSKSTNQSGERNARLPDLCFLICRFSQVVFILRAQTHAQSLFLFPIVFGINLIHFFDEKKDGAAGNSIVCFGASIHCHAICEKQNEELELFWRVQRFWQQKVWTQSHSRGEKLRCKFLAKEKYKILRQY